MPFKKGQSGNTKGRGKGKMNKKTEASLKRVEFVLNLLEKTLDKDIKNLSNRDRVFLWNDLQEYVRPKLARTTIEHEGSVTIKTLEVKYVGKHK